MDRKKVNVFIVDDHEMFRDGLKAILSCNADLYVIGEANNPHDAVNQLSNIKIESPLLVLMDISMYGENSGLPGINRVKEIDPCISVLSISMHPEDQYAIKAIRHGANGFISKGCGTKELFLAISKIASGEIYVSPSVALQMANLLASGGDVAAVKHDNLSGREMEVLKYVVAGMEPKNISRILNISIKTISTHTTNILVKLGLRNRTELVGYALTNGITSGFTKSDKL